MINYVKFEDQDRIQKHQDEISQQQRKYNLGNKFNSTQPMPQNNKLPQNQMATFGDSDYMPEGGNAHEQML